MAIGFDFSAGLSVMGGKLDEVNANLLKLRPKISGRVVRTVVSLNGPGSVQVQQIGPEAGKALQVRRISIGEPPSSFGSATGEWIIYEGGISNNSAQGIEIARTGTGSGPTQLTWGRDEWLVRPPANIVIVGTSANVGQVIIDIQGVEIDQNEETLA